MYMPIGSESAIKSGSGLRLATVTFSGAINYGARLQTYALQRALEDMGFFSEVLDYDSPEINRGYKLFDWHRLFHPRALARNMADLLDFKEALERRARFDSFTQNFIRTTRPLKRQELGASARNYDVCITGSDQVFNGELTHYQKEFFLSFSPHVKRNISYAGSFGFSEIPVDKADWYRKCLDNLGEISCREMTGARIVRELTGREANIDLDPALLLTGEEWLRTFSGRGKDYGFKQDEYILTYMLDERKAIKIADCLQLPLVNIRWGRPLRHLPVGINIYSAGPIEFIELLSKAKGVITGSFHATVFSLLLHKPFLVEPPVGRASRITDLLDEVKLKENYLSTNIESFPIVDWTSVDVRLGELREESKDHLRGMVLRAAGDSQ